MTKISIIQKLVHWFTLQTFFYISILHCLFWPTVTLVMQLILGVGHYFQKSINNLKFSKNPFIYDQLLKATAFMVTPKIIINAHTFCFWKQSKICNTILKTEQTTIICSQWNSWASYDAIKHHMTTTGVIIKIALMARRKPLC